MADLPSWEAEIRAIEADYDNAWGAADLDRLMSALEPDVVILDPRGGRSVGASEARRLLGDFLAGEGAGSTHTSQCKRVSLVTDDVALFDGRATIAGPNLPQPIVHDFTDVFIRRDGRWRIAHIRAYVYMDARKAARMNAAESFATEVRRSLSGHTWFGPSLTEVLEGVDANQAAQRVSGAPHSIWELVAHLGVWARYASYRFEGGVPRELDEENWPQARGTDEAAWTAARADVFDACEQAARALEALSDEALDAVDATTPTDATGEPVTLRRVAAGLPQHVAYHAGQIAVLKQLTTEGASSA